mmetsp:Transcript_133191/g.426067  ORF Transcript_133191/g.426067 Transcript_133191/m.426067 type:complete len:249 (+) Transcript_133191:190-936(+)
MSAKVTALADDKGVLQQFRESTLSGCELTAVSTPTLSLMRGRCPTQRLMKAQPVVRFQPPAHKLLTSPTPIGRARRQRRFLVSREPKTGISTPLVSSYQGHCSKRLIPSHHAWRLVRLHKVRVQSALGIGTDLCNEVLSDDRELVLELSTASNLLDTACGFALLLLASLQRGSRLAPDLQLVLAPTYQVVHVLQQLIPSHHAWCLVRLHEVRALSALGVGADLLAHVLADARKLVLKLGTVGSICSST